MYPLLPTPKAAFLATFLSFSVTAYSEQTSLPVVNEPCKSALMSILGPNWIRVTINMPEKQVILYESSLSEFAAIGVLSIWLDKTSQQNNHQSGQASWLNLFSALSSIDELSNLEYEYAKARLIGVTKKLTIVDFLRTQKIKLDFSSKVLRFQFKERIRPYWKKVARALGLDSKTIDAIEAMYTREETEVRKSDLQRSLNENYDAVLKAARMEPDLKEHLEQAFTINPALETCPAGQADEVELPEGSLIQLDELPTLSQLNHLYFAGVDYSLIRIISPHWQRLARKLGAKYWHIEALELDYRESVFEQVVGFLSGWRHGLYMPPQEPTLPLPLHWIDLIRAMDSVPEIAGLESYQNLRAYLPKIPLTPSPQL
ncbi:MAG: death domain-containing protein [Endozoicomonas sp.]